MNNLMLMKSKKVHKIVLRTPLARQLRFNLRTLLKLAIKEELSRLSNIETLYGFKKNLTSSKKKRRGQLRKEWNKLYHRFHRSTLQCGSGAACVSFQEAKKHGFNPKDRPTNLDLVWVPWLEKWSCVECFETYRQGEMTHQDFDDPVYREWVKNEFGI